MNMKASKPSNSDLLEYTTSELLEILIPVIVLTLYTQS